MYKSNVSRSSMQLVFNKCENAHYKHLVQNYVNEIHGDTGSDTLINDVDNMTIVDDIESNNEYNDKIGNGGSYYTLLLDDIKYTFAPLFTTLRYHYVDSLENIGIKELFFQ